MEGLGPFFNFCSALPSPPPLAFGKQAPREVRLEIELLVQGIAALLSFFNWFPHPLRLRGHRPYGSDYPVRSV